MTEFVSYCPRCDATRSTHDAFASVVVQIKYNWQEWTEVSCICRTCHKMSVHLVSRANAGPEVAKYFGPLGAINLLQNYAGSLNDIVKFERFISLRDNFGDQPPEHLPPAIGKVVTEGNIALANKCFNAAAAMYRLALDLATKGLLPAEGGPNAATRRNLGLRLRWLFDEQFVPGDLRPLAECVQQDGNDGAHDGNLTKEDAEDLHDFSVELLRRLYTEPERIRLAQLRREGRRSS